jgi:two-component sensor histidine kinase
MFSESARAALSGRWAISRNPYIFTAPTTIVSVILLQATTFELTEIWGWFLASTGGYLVFCFLLYLAHVTLYRDRAITPVPVAWIFVIGFVFGAIKGASTAAISVALNLESNLYEEILGRALPAGLLGLAGVPSMALLMHALHEFREKRADLIAEQIFMESKEHQSQELVATMSHTLREKIEDDLRTQTEGLRNSFIANSSQPDSWQLMADDLRTTANETVRNASHELWERPETKVDEISLLDLARAMITTNAFPLRYINPIFLVSAAPVFLRNHGLEELLIRLLALGLTVSITYLLASWAIKKSADHKHQIYLIAIALPVAITSVLSILVFNDDVNPRFFGVFVTMAIWLPILTITCGLIDTSLKQRQVILDELQSRIDKSRIRTVSMNNEAIRLSNDMAKYLHGNLQSRLMASALAIESAGHAQDSSALAEEIEKARQSIQTPFDQFTSKELEPVSIELLKLLKRWDGILRIELNNVGSDEFASATDTRNIIHVIEECFSNSLHHGFATEAKIHLEVSAAGTMLTVIDNGFGPRDGLPGLGSSLFNSIAGSNWSLSRGADGIGTQFKLQINN